MIGYHKIYGPFKRYTEGPQSGKLDYLNWTTPEFKALRNNVWVFTEKVDGTNIRIGWDGHEVTIGGRTNAAKLPGDLLDILKDQFPPALFQQVFGQTPAVLFGEGYGGNIQKAGKLYRPDKAFVLFDVWYNDSIWFERDSVEDIAVATDTSAVPVRIKGTLWKGIYAVSDGLTSSWGDFRAEGLVGTPELGLLNRSGARIIVKVKDVDFYGTDHEL